MIYLIGGTTRTGKSTIGSRILERNSISCISTDIIRNLLAFGPTKLQILDLEWGERQEVFFPYLVQFLKILRNKYEDYAVEGDIFTPAQIASIRDEIPLKCCFLGTSHITLDELLNLDEGPGWVGELSPEEQAKVPDQLTGWSKMFEDEAKKHGFPYFDIHPDQEKALDTAYSTLMN
ncbi:MAG: hypothetical protein WCO52_05350 [bacterium]